MTVPSLEIDLAQLVKQYTLGTLPPDVVRAALYSDSDDFDDVLVNELEGYDFTEKQAELAKLRQKFEEMRLRNQPVEQPSEQSAEHPAEQPGDVHPV